MIPSFKCYFNGCEDCPVERVSWYNVQDFIGRLNDLTNLDYRLPTEAEWEYAAKGGNSSKQYKYSGSKNDIIVAWKVCWSNLCTHPVGHKAPNELGTYDMTGNVFEWCAEWYAPGWYGISGSTNPTGPATGTCKVIRGGSWYYDSAGLRNTDRECANPDYRYGYIGFRLCLRAAK